MRMSRMERECSSSLEADKKKWWQPSMMMLGWGSEGQDVEEQEFDK
jgi:hypothetical protein